MFLKLNGLLKVWLIFELILGLVVWSFYLKMVITNPIPIPWYITVMLWACVKLGFTDYVWSWRFVIWKLHCMFQFKSLFILGSIFESIDDRVVYFFILSEYCLVSYSLIVPRWWLSLQKVLLLCAFSCDCCLLH